MALFHRGISLPQTPTRATATSYPHPKRSAESVTHVLGPKCHLCARSFRPRFRKAYGFRALYHLR
jgi:hypothetical protein